MGYDIAGLGNALMDVLVVVDDDGVFPQLDLTRGTMHPVDDSKWQEIYSHFQDYPVQIESGGSCANTIATAGRLGANTIYSGQVGQDDLGELYAQRIEDACGQHALRFSTEHATVSASRSSRKATPSVPWSRTLALPCV